MDGVPCVELPRGEDEALPRHCATRIREALEELGFVRIANHGVSDALISEAYRAFETFFALPAAVKQRTSGSSGGQRGFTAFGIEHAKNHPVPDLKEFFHVGQAGSQRDPVTSQYPPNLWPEEVPELAEVGLRLFVALERCARRLLFALAESYGLPGERFAGLIDRGNSILRAAHYPPVADPPPGALRAAPHEDINLITLLCGATESGLEIESRGVWVPVANEPGEIVVDTGDMLSRLSNRVLPATTHRVVLPVQSASPEKRMGRFALPFFAHARPECLLTAGSPFVTPDRPRIDEPITAGSYLAQRLSEIGLDS